MEEEEETKEVIKRTAPPLSGSHPRKSMRLSQPGGAPQAMSKRARVINDSDQEVGEEEEEEKEEQEEQAKEQAVDVEEVSPTAGKLG